MSFGNFKFGSTPAAGPSTAPNSSLTVPSFSLTGATPTTTPTTNQPFSFGASTSQSASQPNSTGNNSAGGLFGGGQSQQPAARASLFGGTGGSLFGKPAQSPGAGAASSPAAGGGLLGGGSLFGGQQQQPQQQQSSPFGQSTSQPQQSGSGLFGQSTSQTPSSNLFGQSTSQPSQQSTNLFGGQSQSQTQQPSAQNASASNSSSGINKSTKFSDLPDGVQKTIEQMDAWIKQQKESGSGIAIEPLGSAIWQTSSDVRAAQEGSSALTQGLASLQLSITQLHTKYLAEEEDVTKFVEIWQSFKSVDGRPGAVRVAAHRDFPQEFFAKAAKGMEERVGRYKKSIAQLNRVIASLSQGQDTPSAQAIAQTINIHQNALLTLAAQLEKLQLRMNDLRDTFANEYRARTSSQRDPFDVAREAKGRPSVRA